VGVGTAGANAHPTVLASAHEALLQLMEKDLVGNARRLEPVMVQCMNALKGAAVSVASACSRAVPPTPPNPRESLAHTTLPNFISPCTTLQSSAMEIF